MSLSERDIELLNAFHDDELQPDAAKALSARLAREPELREALDEIRMVSDALRSMRPQIDGCPEREKTWTWRNWSIAASLAFFLLAAASVFWMNSTTTVTPLSQHREFLSRSYPANSVSEVQPVSWLMNGVPDLSAANLRLVDMVAFDGSDFFIHYTGVNGCRLTVGVHARTPPSQPVSGTVMSRIWAVNERHYSMIAEGMDPEKFEAIHVLLERWTTPAGPDEITILALRDATSSAQPCAQS